MAETMPVLEIDNIGSHDQTPPASDAVSTVGVPVQITEGPVIVAITGRGDTVMVVGTIAVPQLLLTA
jgi:hypothetical protein